VSTTARTSLPENRRLSRPDAPARNGAPSGNVRGGRDARAREPWDPDALWRRLRTAGRVLLAVVVLGAGIGAAVQARRYVTTSPRFGLKDLRIEGNRHRTKEQVAATAGITLGQNVVELDLEAARARLERDPWIERATLSRRLPASLGIDVVERDAGAILALPPRVVNGNVVDGGTFLATPQGEVFKRLEADDPIDLPVITGIGSDEAASDRESTSQLVRRALDLAQDIERVGLFGGRVQELHVDPDGGISVVIGKRGVRVAFGRGPYRNKVRLGLRVEAELARRSAKPTVVFLDDDGHPDRVVVRLVSALPPAKVTIDDLPAGADGQATQKTPGKVVQ
jgi:cell division protein FtsQ